MNPGGQSPLSRAGRAITMPTARRTLLIVLLAAVALSLVVPALLLGFYVLIWARYASSPNDYLATVESAATRLPIAVEFEELFPGQTDHFITHYGFNRYGGDRTNTWNSQAHFADRYSLTMQVEVVVDYENNTVTPAGEPKFYVIEYYEIDDKGDGGYSGSTRSAGIFGEDEWRKIYDSGGNFSVIGVNIDQDTPVPNFGPLVKAWRRSRIPVSLLDNKPRADEKERRKAK